MRLQTSEFESLLEAMPDGMVGVDHAGVIRFVNRHMESMFGYDSGDLVGTHIETLVPEPFRQVHSGHREGYNDAPVLTAASDEDEGVTLGDDVEGRHVQVG